MKIDCIGHGSQLNRQRLNYRCTRACACVRVQFRLSSRRARGHVRCSLSAQTVTYFRATIYWFENGRIVFFVFFHSFFCDKNASAEARYENPMRQTLRWSSLNYRGKVSTLCVRNVSQIGRSPITLCCNNKIENNSWDCNAVSKARVF